MGLFDFLFNKDENKIVWRNSQGIITCPGDSCPKNCDDTCPIYLNTQAAALMAIGQGVKAIPLYNKALEIAPDFYDAWNNLGGIYGGMGDYQKAYEHYKKAHEYNPNKPNPVYGLMLSSRDLHMYEECIQWCELYSRLSLDGREKPIKNSVLEILAAANKLSDEQLYGKAWLLIVGQTQREEGLKILKELDSKGFIEASVALSMFTANQDERKELLKKAADAGNSEGLWGYSNFIPHSFVPNPDNEDDALWEKYCLEAAEKGSADAMNEMGNIYNRRGNYGESMYWYAMANANDHPQGMMSMSGLARKWSQDDYPDEYEKGSEKYNYARFKCALTYLEMHSNQPLSTDVQEIVRYCLAGEPIAGYLAGDIFESLENYEMAYKMYNSLAFDNDAHGLKCYGDMLLVGRGVEKDPSKAIRTYKLAAEAGDRAAMFVMGEFSRQTNVFQAAYWYGLSHSRGYEHSLQRLTQLAIKS